MKKLLNSYWIRSAFYSILQRFSIILFGLVNYIVLIRSLPTRQMGTWALFLVVTTIFETTKSSLLKNAHIRFVSSSKEKEERSAIASSSLLINASITGVFIVLILFLGNWLSAWLHEGHDLDDMLKAYIPGLIGMVIFSHMEAVQQSHLDFKGVFAGYFVRQLAFFAIIVLHTILKIPFSLPRLSLYLSGCIFLGALVIYLYSRPYLFHRFNPSRAGLKNIFGYGGYIFSSGLIANVFSNVDQVLTARFIPDGSSVAYYNAASRISQLIDVPSYAAADILFPKTSMASVEEGPGKVRYLYERMVAALLCFTIPTGLFILIFPKLMITIIAGSRYVASAPIIQLYVVTGMIGPMQNQAANLLNSIGKSGLCFLLNTLSLVAKLLINCACLFYIGFYGAAIGSMITASIAAVVWQWVLHKQIGSNVPTIARYMLDFYKTLYGNSRKLLLKQ